MYVGLKRFARAVLLSTMLPCLPFAVFSQVRAVDPSAIVSQYEEQAHATALYKDCSALPTWDVEKDKARLEASWNTSFDLVKEYLSHSDGKMAGNALTLEGILTHNQFSTDATVQQVLARLQSSKLIVSVDSGAAFTVQSTPPRLVVDTGLIRHACDYLWPHESFDSLRATLQKPRPEKIYGSSETVKNIRDKAHHLANAFLIQSIRYQALKLFVIGHETSHVSLDAFSEKLKKAEGYQGQSDCVPVLYLETRADILGEGAVQSIPMERVYEEVRANPASYSNSLRDKFEQLAERAAYKDQLTILETTKEWFDYSGCQFTAKQRRATLDLAFAREDQKRSSQKKP